MTKVLVEDKTSSQSPLYSILSTQFSCSLGRVTMPNKFSLFLPLFPANTPLNGYYNLHVLANLYLCIGPFSSQENLFKPAISAAAAIPISLD